MILLISNSLSGGGAEVVAREHLKWVKQAGIDITVASSELDSDCYLIACKSRVFSALFCIVNMYRLLKYLFFVKPRVIHCHNFLPELSPSVLFAIRCYRFFKKTTVYQTLHDFHPVCPNSSLYNDAISTVCRECLGGTKSRIIKKRCYKNSFFGSFFKYFRYLIFRYIGGHRSVVDYFICPSQFMRKTMIDDGVAEHRLIYIANPLSFQISGEPVKDRPNALIYMGRLSKEKGVDVLLNAVSEANLQIPIYICGDGPHRSALEKKCLELDLKHVSFLGFLTKQELRNVAAKSSVLVLPSIWFENAPMVLFEAILLGLVPVCSNVGGMKEFVERSLVGRLFDVGSSDDLASVLINLLSDSALDFERSRVSNYLEDNADRLKPDYYLAQIMALYNKSISQ